MFGVCHYNIWGNMIINIFISIKHVSWSTTQILDRFLATFKASRSKNKNSQVLMFLVLCCLWNRNRYSWRWDNPRHNNRVRDSSYPTQPFVTLAEACQLHILVTKRISVVRILAKPVLIQSQMFTFIHALIILVAWKSIYQVWKISEKFQKTETWKIR